MREVMFVASSIFLFFWGALGVGIAMAVIRDNETLADTLMVGGFVGIIYTCFSLAIAWMIWAMYLEFPEED